MAKVDLPPLTKDDDNDVATRLKKLEKLANTTAKHFAQHLANAARREEEELQETPNGGHPDYLREQIAFHEREEIRRQGILEGFVLAACVAGASLFVCLSPYPRMIAYRLRSARF